MIRLKDGVSLDNVHHRMYLAAALAAPIWAKYGSADLTITGGNEDGHSTGLRGFHRLPDGTCQALDLRTKSIPEAEHRKQARSELAHVLGEQYDVLFEHEGGPQEHIHVQWDPDRPGTA